LTALINNMIRVTFWWNGICKSTIFRSNYRWLHQ
jgi:hypothetical protein